MAGAEPEGATGGERAAAEPAGAAEREVLDLRCAQQRAWRNKLVRGFNVDDVPLELALLQRELSEFFTCWQLEQPGQGEELADVVIFALGLAEMIGADLAGEITAKLAKN